MIYSWDFDYTNNNCWHFCRKFWLELTGVDIGDRSPAKRVKFAEAVEQHSIDFDQLDKVQSPCLVVATRPPQSPHVGIYYQGKVVHAKLTGIANEPLDLFKKGFKQVAFYLPKCKNSG